MNKRRALGVVGGILLVAAAACTSSEKSEEVAGCKDVIQTLARAYARCGAEYATVCMKLLNDLAKGDCNNVKDIRDPAGFKATCVATLDTISCVDLNAPKLDPTCDTQVGVATGQQVASTD